MAEIKNLAKVIEVKTQTFDYQNYTMLEGVSRKVDSDHVRNVVESFMNFGAEATSLIILETKAFGKVQRIIADGNHRATGGKLLNLPLDIKVVKLTDDTIINVKNFIACLNNSLKKWNNVVYLEVFAEGKVYEYMKFKQIMAETNLKITDLLFLYCGSGSTKQFQLGNLKFKNEKQSDKMLEEVKRMLSVLPKHTFTRRSLWRIMKKVDNHKKLATEIIKFSKNGFSADETTFKLQLNEIYEKSFSE
jgi:hypothetical protein